MENFKFFIAMFLVVFFLITVGTLAVSGVLLLVDTIARELGKTGSMLALLVAFSAAIAGAATIVSKTDA